MPLEFPHDNRWGEGCEHCRMQIGLLKHEPETECPALLRSELDEARAEIAALNGDPAGAYTDQWVPAAAALWVWHTPPGGLSYARVDGWQWMLVGPRGGCAAKGRATSVRGAMEEAESAAYRYESAKRRR